MSFKRNINFNRLQNISIRRSSSAVIQNLGERDIKIRVGVSYGVKGLAGDDVMGESNYEQ